MSSNTEEADLLSTFESLLNRDLSLLLPFILGFTASSSLTIQDQQTLTGNTHTDRIILINPFTQGMVVIEGTDNNNNLDALFREFTTKTGQPPASKASIDAMPSVEITEIGECSICLEDWEPGLVVKEMPCKHRFHGACIDKWLGIHGSCPVCRYKMPVDKEERGHKRDQEEEEEERRVERQVWVSLSFDRNRNSQHSNQTPSTDSDSNAIDQQMEN